MLKAKITLFVMTIGWLLFFLTTIISALPYSPVSPNHGTKEKVLTHVLQGWGFFSKDPRDDLFGVHILDGNDNNELQWPNISISNLLGLKREGRAQGIEAGNLYSQIIEPQTISCTGDIVRCLTDADVSQILTNKDNRKTLCGLIGFSLSEPVPWAWGKSYTADDMNSEIIKVNVVCE
ncbi:hypothetical protein SporoP8_10930 [Sporosarcina ureae]|uniref:SdpA family antimicrobial peptide system protein n=1 Tax=Sporosarcina ureae TaxID=1571 RepID=UPI000A146541|nr:SdpA family antimicrobial peptide system protein [Sporosarcina ureae]ARJ39341.1 hypothetical protein SporoP8_10930 [Sporosarcina ureae]